MNTSNISQTSSTDTNCYESVVDDSVYYSFNETLKEQKQSILSLSQNIENNNNIDGNVNPGTVIKKINEKSPLHGATNKNLLNIKTFSSHTSTPTHNSITKHTKSQPQKQQHQSETNISGVIPFMEQRNLVKDEEFVIKDSSVKDLSFLNSTTAGTTTASLFEFEKFEQMFEQKQQYHQQKNEFDNDDENLEVIDEINLNLSKISVGGEKNKNESCNRTPIKNEIIKDDDKSLENKNPPIIIVVPPLEECENIFEIKVEKENTPLKKICESTNFEIDENENKENVNTLFHDISSKESNQNISKNKNLSRKSLIDNYNIKNENIQNSIFKEFPIASKEESVGSVSDSSAVLRTTTEAAIGNAMSIISENTSLKILKDESSAKESDDNRNVISSKKKIRRSIRLSRDSKKSLLIEETDSSSDAASVSYRNKNRKLQKLSADIKKQLRRPSSVCFVEPRETNFTNKLDLLENVLLKEKPSQRPCTTNLPKIEEKPQNQKQKNQSTNNFAVKENIQQQQKKNQLEKNSAVNKPEPINKLTALNKRESIVKNAKASPRLVKSKARLTQAFKTTLNSPSMVRQSVGAKKLTRKSLLPIALRKNKSSESIKAAPFSFSTASTSNKPITLPVTTTADVTTETFKIPSSTTYSCHICHITFKFKSNFESHKIMHSIGNKCKYCDKSFAFKKALDNHQMENCSRIPPLIKKKLVQTEIKKKDEEQLQRLVSKSIQTTTKLTTTTTTATAKHPLSMASSTALLNNIGQTSSIGVTDIKSESDIPELSALSCDGKEFLEPKQKQQQCLSSKKKIKNLPYSGIYRTPNKPIKCYKCKKNFLNVLAFTEHSLSHSSSSSSSS